MTVSSGTYPKPYNVSGNGPDDTGISVSTNGITYGVYTFTIPNVTYTVNYTCNNATYPVYMMAIGGGRAGGTYGAGSGGAGGMIYQGGSSLPAPYSTYGGFGSGGGSGLVGTPANSNSAKTNETGDTYYSPLVVYANNGGSAGPGSSGGGGGGANQAVQTKNGGNGRQTTSYGIKEFNPKETAYSTYYWAVEGGSSQAEPGGNGGSGGGGRGGSFDTSPAGSGVSGLNSGGNGSINDGPAGNGGANTGGGGGGKWTSVTTGYGGSDIVVIAFPQ